jgi:hypothetical protein
VDALTGPNAEKLCLELLYAATEAEVISALKARKLWDREAWVPYGNISNNRGVVGNQQSAPVAALVEKLVNSLDSILIAECQRRGIDPTGTLAPQTMADAVEQFFGVREGRLETMDSIPRDLAERVMVVATGTKEQPAYVVVDDGEGQQPDRFPDTFLSLLRENKRRIPFVQGKFNMGGTGVLQFAGENSFQLIVSRRRPDIPADGSAEYANLWGFTLVRRLRPGPDDPQSTYVYLAPGGQIPSFDTEFLPLRPGTYPTAFGTPVEHGTCIKLWNYKLPGRTKTLATLDFRYALERYLQEPALPVRIMERRAGYRAHTFDTSMSGLGYVLSNAGADKEPGLDGGTPLHVPNVGDIELAVAVIKEDADRTEKRYPAGVFFVVNGQMHSQLGVEFFKRRKLKLDYIADSLIVRADCTNLPADVREDLFLASRDRMRDIDERSLLEDQISEYLSEHPGLRELNARRRQKAITESSDEDTAAVLQELVKSDPTLAAIFGAGTKIKVPVGPLPEAVTYEGKRYPTYFRLSKEPEGGLVRRTPRNWTVRIECETDASNDYFSPGRADRGRIETAGIPVFKSVHLWNGKATLRFEIPESCSPGDRLRAEVRVMDESRVDPFVIAFSVEVLPDEPHQPWGTPGPHVSQVGGIPNVKEVRQAEWGAYGFDEYSAVLMRHGDEDDRVDMFINMDNLYLRNELVKRRALGEELVRSWFKYGLLVLCLGMLYRQRQDGTAADDVDNGETPKQDDEFASIALASKGLAVTVIPLMAQLTKKLEAV